MKRTTNYHMQLAYVVAASLLIAANPSLAAKGGNGKGGGKPGGGGDDPPATTLPVTYSVTPIGIPGSGVNLFGFSENGAMVGNVTTLDGRRGLAYLPSYSASGFYMDDPDFNLQGIPAGWHTRNAVDINGVGTIVGNLAADVAPDDFYRSFVVTGATSGSPVLHELPVLNATAQKESAVGINEHGDIIIWSEKTTDAGTTASAYIGNVDSNGVVTQPFVELNLADYGYPDSHIDPETLQITDRTANGNAIAVGQFYNDGSTYTFRVNSDGSGFETAPSYYREDGSLVEWTTNWGTLDVNNAGSVTGGAEIYPVKQGKQKYNLHAGLWEYGSDEILPVGDFDPFEAEWWTAALNDDGDFLLQSGQGPGDALWHGDWSPANGELDIASLIDPNDPNAYLYSHTFDLTNRNAHGWPTILAEGYETLADGTNQPYWLILTPQLTSSALSSTAVPEPAGVLLGILAVSSLAVFRRVI